MACLNSCRTLPKLGAPISLMSVRCLGGPKRKYPINPAHVNDVPISEFKKSKKTYRRLFSWGNIHTGALGLKGLLDKNVSLVEAPKRMTFGEKFEVTTAAAGFGFSAFAVNSDTDVKLYGSGINTDSQIGYHEVRTGHPLGIVFYPQPISLPLKDSSSSVKKLSAGRAHMVALTDEGLFLLGNNAYGQCGRQIVKDEDYSKSNLINHVKNIEGKAIVDVECGQDHTMLLTEDGAVYSCGWGADGQTGLGHFNNCDRFTKLKGDIENECIVKLACRSDFVLAVSNKHEVFGWGNTEYGQITCPSGDQQLANPTWVDTVNRLGEIKSVATAGSFCLVLTCSGEVYSWGYGLLGLGPNVELSVKPLKIPSTLFGRNDFQPNSRVVEIACGLNYAAAVTNLGDLYTWGRNKNGCLGLGNNKDQYFPFKVSLGGVVQNVFCGIDHTIALCKPFI